MREELGKMPPQEIELETAVLGAMILEKDALLAVADIIDPSCFYKEAHRIIYEFGILPLYRSNRSVDMMTVTNQLKKEGQLEFIGGPYYVVEVTNRVASTVHVADHAKIIRDAAIKRDIINKCSEAIRMAYDPSTEAEPLLDSIGRKMDEIALKVDSRSFVTAGSVVKEVLDKVEELGKSDETVTGVPSGYAELDRMTNGFQGSDFIVLAARPGMGKTSFALNVAENVSIRFNTPVAFFSLEMSTDQLVQRSIASQADIELWKLKTGTVNESEWVKINNSITPLMNSKLFVDDSASLSIFQAKTKLRRLKHDHPDLKFVIIDYLQLMSGRNPDNKSQNREQEISYISRNLKVIAKELDLCVMALSQLSRAVESRGGDKRPMLSDLRESGAIEQDSDMVIFVYRPEYYDIVDDGEGGDLRNKGILIISKNRHGALGDVGLGFFASKCKFTELNDFSNMDDGLSQLPFINNDEMPDFE